MKGSVNLFTFKVGEGNLQRVYSYPMREVRALAAELGMDLTQDKEFIWFLKQALVTILPQGWQREKDPKGTLQYHNPLTGATTERHPLLYLFRAAFSQLLQSSYESTAISADTHPALSQQAIPVRTHSEQEAFFAELLRKVQRTQDLSDSDRLKKVMNDVELFYETLITEESVPASIEDSLEYKCLDPKQVMGTAEALGVAQDYRLLWIARLFCALPLPPLWQRSTDAFRNELFLNTHYSVSIQHHPSQNFFYKFIQRLKFSSLEAQSPTMTFLDTQFHEYEVDLRRLVAGSKDYIIRVSSEPVAGALSQAKFFQKRSKASEMLNDVMALEIAESCGVQLEEEIHLLGVVHAHFAEMKMRSELAGWEFRYSTEGQKYWYHPETQRAMKSYPFRKVLKTAIDDARIVYFRRFEELTKQTGEIHPIFEHKSPQLVSEIRHETASAMAHYLRNIIQEEPKDSIDLAPILLKLELKRSEKAEIQQILFACPFQFPAGRLQDSALLRLQEGWEVESNMSAVEREDVKDMLEDIKQDVHHMESLTEMIKKRALKGLFMRPTAQSLPSTRKNSRISPSVMQKNTKITPFSSNIEGSPEQLRAKSTLAGLLSVKSVNAESRHSVSPKNSHRPSVRVAETLKVPGETPALSDVLNPKESEATSMIKGHMALLGVTGAQVEVGAEEAKRGRDSTRRKTSFVKRQSEEKRENSAVAGNEERWTPESEAKPSGKAELLDRLAAKTDQEISKTTLIPAQAEISPAKSPIEVEKTPIIVKNPVNISTIDSMESLPQSAIQIVESPHTVVSTSANPTISSSFTHRLSSSSLSNAISPHFPSSEHCYFGTVSPPSPGPLVNADFPSDTTLLQPGNEAPAAPLAQELEAYSPLNVANTPQCSAHDAQTATPSPAYPNTIEIATIRLTPTSSLPRPVGVQSPDEVCSSDQSAAQQTSLKPTTAQVSIATNTESLRETRRASFGKQKNKESSTIHETLKALLRKMTNEGLHSPEAKRRQNEGSILEKLKRARESKMALESDSEESEDSFAAVPSSFEGNFQSLPRETMQSAPIAHAPSLSLNPLPTPSIPAAASKPLPKKINLNKGESDYNPHPVTAPATPKASAVGPAGHRPLLTIMEVPSPQPSPIISRFQVKPRFYTPLATDRTAKSGFLPKIALKEGRTERRLEATLRSSKRSISGCKTDRKHSNDPHASSSLRSLRTSSSTIMDPPVTAEACSESGSLEYYLRHIGNPFLKPDISKQQPDAWLHPSHVVQMGKRIGLKVAVLSFESTESDLLWIPYIQLTAPLPAGYPAMSISAILDLPMGKHPGDSFFELMLDYHRAHRRAELTKMSKSEQVRSVIEQSWLEFQSASGHCYRHNFLTGEVKQASSLAILRFGKMLEGIMPQRRVKQQSTHRSQSQKAIASAPGQLEDLQSLVRVRRMKQRRELRISL